MFIALYSLLIATTANAEADCGCRTNKNHSENYKNKKQEIDITIPVTIKCKNFAHLSGHKANRTIAMAYHHSDITKKEHVQRIFVSDGTISSNGKETHLHFSISDKFKKEEVIEKVTAGFKALCTEEKAHLAKPEKERGNIKCWFCHKYSEFMEWVKQKWETARKKGK